MNEFEGQWYDFGGGEECGEVEWASSDLSSELTTIIGPSVAIEEEMFRRFWNIAPLAER